MSLSEAILRDDIRQRLFSPHVSENPYVVGLELELLPVHRPTRKPVFIMGENGPSTLAVLSTLGKRERWLEQSAKQGPPSWLLPDGACISFEPGGQIEISSTPHATISELIESVQRLVATLRAAMTKSGITLLARGVDPYNDISATPLQFSRDRYVRMTRYFDSLGPSGVKMMRQTAALQINVERGSDPSRRWVLLNALAPFIVALFASSSDYAGRPTGHASYRSHLWRTLDPSRTGLPCDATEPAERYLRFALDAKAMHSGDGQKPWISFRDWMVERDVTEEEWIFHLSTLFPEIRPREFFEIRSADAIDTDLLAAPIVFVTGLIYNEESAGRASELLPQASEDLLERAGRLGLNDPDIRRMTPHLTELALSGARQLGERYISSQLLTIAREYFARALAPTT